MNAATLKLVALAEIVRRLLKKNGPHHAWGSEAESLPQGLTTLTTDSIDEFLRVRPSRGTSLGLLLTKQGGVFTTPGAEGELRMLVNVANKTARHKYEFKTPG